MGDYYNTKESVEEYIKMAKGHDGAGAIGRLLEFLPTGSAVLEIGSGPGTDWKNLRKNYQVSGSDNSTEFIKHLQATYPDGEFLTLDASTLDTNSRYDGIYSNKVLHHLEDENIEASIKRQAEILNPGGIVCHTFWKGKDSEIYNDLFVNYHSYTGLKDLFKAHFEPMLIEYYKEFEKNDSILFIGKKKEGLPG